MRQIRLTPNDFEKLINVLKKEQMSGCAITIYSEDTKLFIKTLDRTGKEILITLHDKDYPMMPTITKTETI